jgi:two-component system chemotaxis sensor kinase CheA
MDFDHNAAMLCFRAETEESLSGMEQALVRLEEYPGDDECLNTIFRTVHNLKGNAGALGISVISELAHALEDLLDKLRSGKLAVSSDIISLLLDAVDTIRTMMENCSVPDAPPPIGLAMLIERVNNVRSVRDEAPAIRGTRADEGQPSIKHKRASSTSLRVDVETLDRMVNLAGEIAIARGRLSSALLRANANTEILDLHREADVMHSDLQELVMRLRMVPLGPLFAQFARTVRDVARRRGRLVRLETSGEDVELDTRVIELVRDPLIHLVRNAVDHGIESPEARQAAGKDRCGVVGLHASYEGGNVLIRVSDDGAGLDRESILKRARQLRYLGEDDQITDSDLYRLVFEPGFSTTIEVTELSGRGVGMDVVRRNMEALRGSVSIDSHAGSGTTVAMRIPLTLAIIDGFAVHVADEAYVIPLDCVLECFEMREEQHGSRAGGVVQLRGEPLPFIRLRSAFEVECAPANREHIVVVRNEYGRFGLAVDSLDGEIQAVVKPLGRTFASATDFSGSTILGNGRVALLLDVSRLAQRVKRSNAGSESRK